MLIEFSATNFLSFKNRATLSMVASSDDTLEESNVIATEKHRLVRSAVVYGANASGKSNLLAALNVMRRMVLTSSKDTQVNEEIDVNPFLLSTECDGKPSRFEVVFLQSKTLYRYGFEADRKRVHAEWLFSRPSTKEANYFEREGAEIRVNVERFKEGKGLEDRTRENALFLSVCAQFNGEVAASLLNWFQNLQTMHGFARMGFLDATVWRLSSPEQKPQVLELTKVADPGISDFDLRQKKLTLEDLPPDMPDRMKKDILKRDATIVELKTTHRKVDGANKDVGGVVFDLDENESAGTQKLVKLTGPLLDTLETGKILIVDELDARMHPLLTRLMVSLFNSPANRSNAQLIFASHDTTLLTPKLFRRDQVWFTEKDQYGATDLYSLVELKGVRKEAAFGKEYIQGKYGAIPFIGDPKWLFCEGSHE
jgi:AAA15 family ATPase/GTPase